MNIQKHIFISGRVHGVGFRLYTKRYAESLDIKGWVRNLYNGQVEAVFQGDQYAVDKLVKWCKTGPSSAEVENVEVKEEAVEEGLGEFEVR
ncbi:MAG: acylphosphatase [Candidatus Margulisiibacteriota bacterium]|jgi:acylphosphatase